MRFTSAAALVAVLSGGHELVRSAEAVTSPIKHSDADGFEVVRGLSDMDENFCTSTQQQVDQSETMLVSSRLAGSVLQLSLPSWSGDLCTPTLEEHPGAYYYDCVPSSGSLAFGPDPATAVRAVLTTVRVVDVTKVSEQRDVAPQSRPASGMAVVFTFSIPSPEQLESRNTVLSQKLGRSNLCGRCNRAELQCMQGEISDQLRLIDSGWRTVEHLTTHMEVVAPLNPAPGDVARPCMDTAYVAFGAPRRMLPLHPSEIVFDKGALYIVSVETNRILRFVPGETQATVVFGFSQGDGLDQLDHPRGMLFHDDGALYVVDTENHRILRVAPGEKEAIVYFGGTKGSGLDQLDSPSSMLFHESAFYIVDALNHRILVLMPGGNQASVYFGGTKGDRVDQLDRPSSMLFHENAFYIVDSANHRILKVLLGESQASVYFGGTKGDGPDQLNTASSMLFHEGSCYVADSGNHRILRFMPGEKQASVYFGGTQGDGLDQLSFPISLLFDEGACYVSDSENDRILRFMPGEKQSSVELGGKASDRLDQLDWPFSMVFHDGAFHIVDSRNHRILRAVLGESQASVFFGGTQGSGPDQLSFPRSILFQEDAFYIVDTYNDRILKVLPGAKQARVFFGGTKGTGFGQLNIPTSLLFEGGVFYVAECGNHRILRFASGEIVARVYFGGSRGNRPDQLNCPSDMVFHEEALYVVDTKNSRILKVVPEEREAEVYFGGTKGRGLDQLDTPHGMLFDQGALFVADSANSRILRVVVGGTSNATVFMGQGCKCDSRILSFPLSIVWHEGLLLVLDVHQVFARPLDVGSPKAFGELLQECADARFSDSGGRTVFELGCSVPAPMITQDVAQRDRLRLPSFGFPSASAGSKRVPCRISTRSLLLPNVKELEARASRFELILLVFAGLMVSAHMWGTPRAHAAAACVAAAALGVGSCLGLVIVPHVPGACWTAIPALAAAVLLPWGVAPAYVYWESPDQWRGKLVDRTCSTGIKWEFHVFTTLCAFISISLWLIFSGLLEQRRHDLAATSINSYTLPCLYSEEGDGDQSDTDEEDEQSVWRSQSSMDDEDHPLHEADERPIRRASTSSKFGSLGGDLVQAHGHDEEAPPVHENSNGDKDEGDDQVERLPGGTDEEQAGSEAGDVYGADDGNEHEEEEDEHDADDDDAEHLPGGADEEQAGSEGEDVHNVADGNEHEEEEDEHDEDDEGDEDDDADEDDDGVEASGALEDIVATKFPGALSFLEIPRNPEFLLPAVVRNNLRCRIFGPVGTLPKPCVVARMELLLGWLHGSVLDQYVDLNTWIIVEACGFKYAYAQLWILIIAFLLQNIGGAVYVLRVEWNETKAWWKAVACLITAPPMELLGLKSTGNYLRIVRTVFEDVPQFVFQVMFTYTVKWDDLVFFNLVMTTGSVLFNFYNVYAYCKERAAVRRASRIASVSLAANS